MISGSVQIVDRASAVEAIKRLSEEDLRFLNGLIVERLKLINQLRHTSEMIKFTRGDRVGFRTRDGIAYEGHVLQLNKKTIAVLTDDGRQWKVSPGLLTLIKPAREIQW